ncbi:MAG: undecaprenyl-diphosphate phosphatase [Oscillospiraceae bacterium]|jgi:undecaprenyl-diphosphatase|nr:undecaprenyl-diphosphate phosphatase [Oscillospiraceae bacterium]
MGEFVQILKSVLMGIVQGITEWLPISSTGHMLLLDEFIKITVSTISERNNEFFNVFKVFIQLGSILAVLVLYFDKLNPFSTKKSDTEKRKTLSLWGKVLVASIPAGIIGVLFDDAIDGVLSRPFVIAAALIVYGFLFLLLENRKLTPKIHNFSQMSYKTALLIGVCQMLALIPGTSRSGSTILGAVFLGTSRFIAAEFSFFMAIPAMLGGSGIRLIKFALENSKTYGSQYPALFSGLEWGVLLTGFFVAFIVSIFVIKFLISFIKSHDFKVFGYYRILLGMLVLIYFGFIAV